MNTRRCILILLDGLGDRGHKELGGLTPLQAAATPSLDKLAGQSSCGLLSALRPGAALPSENAHLRIFGYSPDELPGRGLLEALGAGIKMGHEEVAVLTHFASVRPDESGSLVLNKDRPEAAPEEIQELIKAVGSHTGTTQTGSFHPTHGLDGIIRLGPQASARITDTFPICEGMNLIEPEAWADGGEWAAETAAALKTYLLTIYERLRRHPVNLSRQQAGKVPINFLVTQRAGRNRNVQPFSQRWGLKGLTISAGLVYKGLAKYIGLDHLNVSDCGEPGQDLSARLKLAGRADPSYDFIHVHSKAPDAAAHTKSPANKVRAIESLDRGIGEVMNELTTSGNVIIVTADHSTPSSGPLIHSGEPVPIMISGPGTRLDAVQTFNEISCAGGALGHLRGEDFMYVVLNALERVKLRGLMDTPWDQPFWPGDRRPFQL